MCVCVCVWICVFRVIERKNTSCLLSSYILSGYVCVSDHLKWNQYNIQILCTERYKQTRP